MKCPPQTQGTGFNPHPAAICFNSTSSSSHFPSGTDQPADIEPKRSAPSNEESGNNESQGTPSKKVKTSAASVKKPNITQENLLLLELKDKNLMKWPDIVEAFRERGWGGRKVGLLKNRYKSIKEGTVFWEDDDASQSFD